MTDDYMLVNRSCWDALATFRLRTDRPCPLPARFDWCQFTGHGPDVGLLRASPGQRLVEVGCGAGDHIAYLANRGIPAVGVDFSEVQIALARKRWRCFVPSDSFIVADVIDYLGRCPPIDVCYSIFGAIGHVPSHIVLPAIWGRLVVGGRLVFSVTHPEWSKLQQDSVLALNGLSLAVRRFLAKEEEWRRQLGEAGFNIVESLVLEDPDGSGPCCLVMVGEKCETGAS